MDLREWINDNRPVVNLIGIGLIILAVVLLVVRMFLGGAGPEGNAPAVEIYYYDTRADALFPASNALTPPIEGPSGEPAAWPAEVFRCGGCGEVDTDDIAYLRKRETVDGSEREYYARPAAEPNWRLAASPEGAAIRRAARRDCPGGGTADSCLP